MSVRPAGERTEDSITELVRRPESSQQNGKGSSGGRNFYAMRSLNAAQKLQRDECNDKIVGRAVQRGGRLHRGAALYCSSTNRARNF